MTIQRDFLERAPAVVGSSNEEMIALLREQNDYMQDIALYLRQLNADVLATAIVLSSDQFTIAITDTNSHEVKFQVGGKPVEIHKLLAFNTFNSGSAAIAVSLSVQSLSKVADGVPVTTTPFWWDIHTHSVFVRTAYDGLSTHPLVVNGPSDSFGGLFLYGFTIPDWDRIRGAMRSMQ